MVTIITDEPIEVQCSVLRGTGCICFMPSGSRLSFLDGTYIKVSPCSTAVYNKLKSRKK